MLSTNKTKVLQIRLTPEEYAKLVKLASDPKVSLSEWLRRAINKA